MQWIFFHGVFGDWGWENLDDAGRAIAESRMPFESRQEAEVDAALHGYARPVRAAPSVRHKHDIDNVEGAVAADVARSLEIAAALPPVRIPGAGRTNRKLASRDPDQLGPHPVA